MARSVLGQPCCASAAERNWSVYGQIKTTSRSNMSHAVSDKRVYCHEALHMREKLTKAGYKQKVEEWDLSGTRIPIPIPLMRRIWLCRWPACAVVKCMGLGGGAGTHVINADRALKIWYNVVESKKKIAAARQRKASTYSTTLLRSVEYKYVTSGACLEYVEY